MYCLRAQRCFLSDPSIASPEKKEESHLPLPARPPSQLMPRNDRHSVHNVTTSSTLVEHPPIRPERHVDSDQDGLPHRRRRAPERSSRPRRDLGAVAVNRRGEVEMRVHLGDLPPDRAREVLQYAKGEGAKEELRWVRGGVTS